MLCRLPLKGRLSRVESRFDRCVQSSRHHNAAVFELERSVVGRSCEAGGGWTHKPPMASPTQRPSLELVLGLTLSLTFVATLVLCAIGCYKHHRERENNALTLAAPNVHPNANAIAAIKPLASAKQQGRRSPNFLATMVESGDRQPTMVQSV